MSMCPFILSSLLGYQFIPFGTSTASSMTDATLMVSGNGRMEEWENEGMGEWRNEGMGEWSNGRMEEWENKGMGE